MPPNVTYTQVNQDDIDGMALADLLASSTGPCWFNGVDFSGEDFSRKDFRGARFERCILAGTRFAAAKLESTEWINCRAAQAHFNTVTLTRGSASDARSLQSPLPGQPLSTSR